MTTARTPRTRTARSRPAGGASALVAAVVIGAFVALLYVVEAVDVVLRGRLDLAGIQPREVEGIDGILWAPLLHGSWSHLMANTVPLLVFGFLILLAGVLRWALVTAVVWTVGGAGTWVAGGDNTLHVGASVLAFGWLVFLLVRGLFSGSARHIVLGVVLLVLYGGLLWGVLPGQPGVSWQGHLFGALGGLLAARWLGRRDREARAGRLPRTA